MTVAAEILSSRYISLTSFRKDGTAVATPVWHVVSGDEMFVVSEAGAWKVKRIRRNPHVVVTVCNIRGKVASGAATAEGTARLLDQEGTQAARALLARKYVMSRVGNWFSRVLRLRRPPVIAIAIRF